MGTIILTTTGGTREPAGGLGELWPLSCQPLGWWVPLSLGWSGLRATLCPACTHTWAWVPSGSLAADPQLMWSLLEHRGCGSLPEAISTQPRQEPMPSSYWAPRDHGTVSSSQRCRTAEHIWRRVQAGPGDEGTGLGCLQEGERERRGQERQRTDLSQSYAFFPSLAPLPPSLSVHSIRTRG